MPPRLATRTHLSAMAPRADRLSQRGRKTGQTADATHLGMPVSRGTVVPTGNGCVAHVATELCFAEQRPLTGARDGVPRVCAACVVDRPGPVSSRVADAFAGDSVLHVEPTYPPLAQRTL